MTERISIINGPNLNLLGQRKPELYGSTSLEQIKKSCLKRAAELGFDLDFMQSNHEGELVEELHRAAGQAAAVIINPAAYGHTSIALYDALETLKIPVVEVHLSNIHRRESFRQVSYVSAQATAVIAGAGAYGYLLALDFVAQALGDKGSSLP